MEEEEECKERNEVGGGKEEEEAMSFPISSFPRHSRLPLALLPPLSTPPSPEKFNKTSLTFFTVSLSPPTPS